jgi:hypothetical protein
MKFRLLTVAFAVVSMFTAQQVFASTAKTHSSKKHHKKHMKKSALQTPAGAASLAA